MFLSYIIYSNKFSFFQVRDSVDGKTSTNSSSDFSSGCRVYVWGLNDKDQLGGMKGSKVKLPVLSDILSQLQPIHIAGGSKSLFIVSREGKVSIFTKAHHIQNYSYVMFPTYI